ncbi:MAG: hypothetical protein LCH37_09475 [Bacteroidetes bacterium]|nr:hypothetical protein [Bacteroidota bacterium]
MNYASRLLFVLLLSMPLSHAFAQTDSTATEEDYGEYDNLSFAGDGNKNYCSNKIEGLSPSKLISLGYDFQGPQTLSADGFNSVSPYERAFGLAHGLRFAANVPVISRNSIIVQMSANYQETRYQEKANQTGINGILAQALTNNGLRSLGLGTTIFKPLDGKKFLLFQGSADLNGDWQWGDFMPLKYLKYSAAAVYGLRTSDRKQWGIGLSRTYRAGELNYIPILLFNSTNPSNTWGTEILFPARAHVRRTFSPRSMAFFGYELEGQSYRLWFNPSTRGEDLEIRRSEIRLRFVYERSLKDFIWMSLQVGYRINYSYNVDRLPDGKDFYRGFFGTQPMAMENKLTNPLYINLSINLVSP